MSLAFLPSLDRVQARFWPRAGARRAAALSAAGKHSLAFELFVRAARAGLAEAAYRVGRCYLDGAGVPRSRVEGVRWLKQAAEQSHIEAQSLLAVLYLGGATGEPPAGSQIPSLVRLIDANETADPDYLAAARWARAAAEAGCSTGQAVLAFILSSGPEEMRNLQEADRWYQHSAAAGCPQGMLGHALALARKGGDETVQRDVVSQLTSAAEAGLPTALYLLGVINEHGLGVPSDPAAAAQFYRGAAEKGHRSGQVRWGWALVHGAGVKAQPLEGETWLRRAALAGDPEAAVLIGDLYAKGGNLPPNYAEAATWFQRAAAVGHKGAARALGFLYLTGAGVPTDAEEAAQWFRVSALAGDPTAQVQLGNLVLNGIGDDDDRRRTCQWFEHAATSGDLVAAFNYGACLAQGVGVARNDTQAALWLRKAADEIVDAQYWYGRILLEGRGVDRDARQGRAFITRAAEAGMLDAQVALGEMLLNGTGGERDPTRALVWFETAALKGHVGAMFTTATLYSGCCDLPSDTIAAERWLRAAAERGHTMAQSMLGRSLVRKTAVQPDREPPRLGDQDLTQIEDPATADQTARLRAVASTGAAPEQVMTDQETLCPCSSGLRRCRCCDLDPNWVAPPEAQEHLNLLVSRATQAFAKGDMAGAQTLCVNALDLAPRLPALLFMLYQIHNRGGCTQAALAILRRVVALEPNNVDATQELAMMLFQLGDLTAAEAHARNSVRLAPAHPRSHNLMGMILTEAQRPEVGEFHYRRVMDITDARDPILLANLAWNLKGQGRIAEARQLYEASVAAGPEVFQTWFGWAQLEEADRNFAVAKSYLNRATELRANDVGVQVARAALLARERNYAAALAELEPGVTRQTGYPGGAFNDPNALMAKGRILDQLERYDEAFACFTQAKQRARELTGKSYLEHAAHEGARRLQQFFVGDRVRLLPLAPVRPQCAQPIFILGFPRSGTTLAEQALCGHPRIAGGDELPFINELSEAIPRLFASPLSYPEALAELWMGDQRRGLELCRDAYLQKVEMKGILNADVRWFTDKMPLNEMHLGLISLVFPHSPLVHILRHPLDVVLSAFSHHFSHGYFCAYGLETIARHYVLVMDLVQHYRTQMTLRYLPMRYEEMVEDMAGSVRRILDFIGEPFDDRCVNFQDNRRLPHTPSYAQVAEKLYVRSRFRYRHYMRHLEPVLPILQPLIDRLGYSVD
jgi:TPR repeat protein/tetratricopeptide (TPR) repeat protein